MNKLNLKVVETRGNCHLGHKVGDVWEIDAHLTPCGICSHAYHLLYPWFQVLSMGGKAPPWQENEDRIRIPCIDEKDTVIFEISRIN